MLLLFLAPIYARDPIYGLNKPLDPRAGGCANCLLISRFRHGLDPGQLGKELACFKWCCWVESVVWWMSWSIPFRCGGNVWLFWFSCSFSYFHDLLRQVSWLFLMKCVCVYHLHLLNPILPITHACFIWSLRMVFKGWR